MPTSLTNPLAKLTVTALLGSLGLIALLPVPANAQEMGRLFTTPERRQSLDRQRELNIQEKQEIPEDPTLTINGVVTRSSGKRTVWINGVPQNENEAQGGMAITPVSKDPGKVVVQSGESLQSKAKVGDTVSRGTGETTDLLGDGKVTIRPSTAPATKK